LYAKHLLPQARPHSAEGPSQFPEPSTWHRSRSLRPGGRFQKNRMPTGRGAPCWRLQFFILSRTWGNNLLKTDHCVYSGTGVKHHTIRPQPSISSRQMGTSVAYLRERLERAGRNDLLAAVDARELSMYAAAEAVRRRAVTGRGSENQAKE